MSLISDVSVTAHKLREDAVDSKTFSVNEESVRMMKGLPKWWEVGAARYREMRWNGETPLPKPVILDGKNSSIPSRDDGRSIPIRIFKPATGDSKGVYMHIHGGGWVLQSEAYQDTLLKFTADAAQLTVVSIGYRLAPEDPFPAGPNDCYDAAEYLVDKSTSMYGGPLMFVGGESAGGHLSALVCFHLLKTRPDFQFRGLCLHFGAFDLSNMLPQSHHFDKPLILTKEILDKYIEAFCPDTTIAQRTDPSISPFFANLKELARLAKSGTLPPALFTCGTADPLLDDTIMMGMKWMMSGAEAIVKLYEGAAHGFIQFSPDVYPTAGRGLEDFKTFLLSKSK